MTSDFPGARLTLQAQGGHLRADDGQGQVSLGQDLRSEIVHNTEGRIVITAGPTHNRRDSRGGSR